ncbi:MAG: fructose-6-phosphate aldolase [Anaerolineales bacterium]|nr:fructose-6-phosphate aldolase [Anaerolineales bacterium]
MKVWLDTANLDEIREGVSWGVVRGVTTNPTHIANAGVTNFRDHILRIIDLVEGPVSAEVVSTDWEGMVREAEQIARWSPHVVVKIPTIIEGLKAMKVVKTFATINATLIFTSNQAYMAAAAGAHYVSPFINRLDVISQDGMQLVRDCVQIFKNYGWNTEVVSASIRTVRQVQECLLVGSQIVTMPLSILRQMMDHPLTEIGLKMFLDDWAKVAPLLAQGENA